MEDPFVQFVLGLAAAAVIGLCGAIWRLWNSHNAHKLHVAEHYVKRDHMQAIKNTLEDLTLIVHEIAGKLGVSIRGHK